MNTLRKNYLYILFFTFFCLYLTLAYSVTYNNLSVIKTLDLVFNSDPPRVYDDLVNINDSFYGHFRIVVHPLMLILLRPLVLAINAFTNSLKISVLILGAIVSSLNVVFINLIVKKITSKSNLAIWLSIVFGLSCSTLVFSSIPETYIYSAFFFNLFLYYFCYLYIKNKPLSSKNLVVISLLIILCTGIEIINFLPCILMILFLFFRIYGKAAFGKIVKVLLISLFIFTCLFLAQKDAYMQTPKLLTTYNFKEKQFFDTPNINNILVVAENIFAQSFYSLKLIINRDYLTLTVNDNQEPWRYIFADIFILVPLIFYFFNHKKYNYNSLILVLMGVIGLLFCGFIFYMPKECFLFTQSVLPFLILLLALIYSQFNNKIINSIFSLFILNQIFCNIYAFKHIFEVIGIDNAYMPSISEKMLDSSTIIAHSCIVTIFFAILIFIFKKFVTKEFFKLNTEKFYEILCGVYIAYILIFNTMIILFNGAV